MYFKSAVINVLYFCVPVLYKVDTRTAPFLCRHGAQIGGFRVFLVNRNQNNPGSSGAYMDNVTCIYCGLTMKIDL